MNLIIIYIFIGIVALTLGFLAYTTYEKISMNKRIKDRKITPRKVSNSDFTNNQHYNTWLNFFMSKLDKERIEISLIHAGNPLNMKTSLNYVVYKFIFTIGGIILGLELYNGKNITQSIILLTITAIIGFFITDYIVSKGKKSRIEQINGQLPLFLVYFDTYNKAGLLFEDILSTVKDALKGELKKEVIRFDVSYSMTKDFEGSLKSFINRLGTPDADSLEIKLRQCYFSGVYDNVLSDEQEMIEKKILNDMAKQTKKFELYLAIGMALLLLNLFLILIYPLSSIASGSMTNLF